jgi:hypothetical protein
VFTLRGRIRDTRGAVAGRAQGAFTQTGRRQAHGAATFLLRDGRITVTGALAGSGTDALAIAGGTGAYSGARGTVTVSEGDRVTRFSFAFAG